MKVNLFNLAVVIALFGITFAKLSILAPGEMTTRFVNNSIKYSVANYGVIPYGKRIIGQVQVPVNITNGCQSMENLNSTNSTHNSVFLLIDRGNCTFVTKSRNAQAIGAKMAIIIDNIIEETEYITMGDDGLGDTVQIPTIFISQRDGNILKNSIKDAVNPQDVLTLVVDFYTAKVDKANYNFWMMLPGNTLIALLEGWNEIRGGLEKQATFTPHYFFYQNRYAGIDAFKKVDANCLGGGRYCCFDPDGDGIATGQDIAQEQLNQICIFQTFGEELWWKYMLKFEKTCVKPQLFKVCSDQIIQDLNFETSKLKKCYDESFISNSEIRTLELKENYLLNAELEERSKAGILEWPSVVINNITYRGKLQPENIMQAVCVSMNEPTEKCNYYIDSNYIKPNPNPQPNNDSDNHIGLIIGIVVGLLVIFFVFMVYCYRRMIRREMQQDMQAQVSQVFAQYVQFSDSNKEKTTSNAANLNSV